MSILIKERGQGPFNSCSGAFGCITWSSWAGSIHAITMEHMTESLNSH